MHLESCLLSQLSQSNATEQLVFVNVRRRDAALVPEMDDAHQLIHWNLSYFRIRSKDSLTFKRVLVSAFFVKKFLVFSGAQRISGKTGKLDEA